jgi:hypothetical protein
MGTQNEKWVLTVKEMHLGHCKETFRAGAVIELDEANGRLIIDGRRFQDTRDLDVLKRQAAANPRNPWIIPYSPEARERIIARYRPVGQSRKVAGPNSRIQDIEQDSDLNEEEPTAGGMPVVQSDEDSHQVIDISDTKVSRVNAQAKEAARQKKGGAMEVIRGDETVEERLANLKGKTDMSSIAERARLKASGAVKMDVVRDDSLGAGFGGKNHPSLNAGQPLPSREEAEARTADAQAIAEARKKEAEIRRQKDDEAPEAAPAPAPEALEAAPAPEESGDMATLRAENAELKERMEKLEKMLIAQQGAPAPRRARKTEEAKA